MPRFPSSRRSRVSKKVPTALGIMILALVLAGTAAAYHVRYSQTFYNGNLTSSEYRNTGHSYCHALWASEMGFSTGSGGYGTAAVVNLAGSWVASSQSQSGYVAAQISPDGSNAYKALCKNSTPWQITYGATCNAYFAEPDGTCV